MNDRPKPRALIRKDEGLSKEYPWYFSVEHPIPQDDALDYGSMRTHGEAIQAVCDVLAHPERCSPLYEFRRMVTAFQGHYHPDTDPEDYADYPPDFGPNEITDLTQCVIRCGYDPSAEALRVLQEVHS